MEKPYQVQTELIQELLRLLKDADHKAHEFKLSDDYRKGVYYFHGRLKEIVHRHGK